jgi:hypothetical protein
VLSDSVQHGTIIQVNPTKRQVRKDLIPPFPKSNKKKKLSSTRSDGLEIPGFVLL